MRRVVVAAACIALLILAIAWLTCNASSSDSPRTSKAVGSVSKQTHRKVTAVSSIAGRVLDKQTNAPIAGAIVCANASGLDSALERALPCTASDARGAYKLEGLRSARYNVSASARGYRPAYGARQFFELAAGAHAREIDVRLRGGGVEVTGVINDLTGGVVANARVAMSGAVAESAKDGSYSLWVAPESSTIVASADGYARTLRTVHAPATIDLTLTPESVISGVVVDAVTKEPVEGARVELTGERVFGEVVTTDEKGQFQASGLDPGRYAATARTDRGYGHTPGSVLVGLGLRVDGVTIELHRAARVDGKVIVSSTKQPCPDSMINLHDEANGTNVSFDDRPDGTAVGRGILPGTYKVSIECAGYASKKTYPDLVVGTDDLATVWEVDPGATIEGTVRDKSGALLEEVYVSSHNEDFSQRVEVYTDSDGRFVLEGLRPGTISIAAYVGWSNPTNEKIRVATGERVRRDLVIADTGEISGTVTDAHGKPIADATVRTESIHEDEYSRNSTVTDENGRFFLRRVAAGDYFVVAERQWRRRSKNVRSARVAVTPSAPVKLALVLDDPTGVIAGMVIDDAGRPAADAFVTFAREKDDTRVERDRLGGDRYQRQPIITGDDGKFAISDLPIGSYAIRAYRHGGADAVADHVATGTTVELQLKKLGSIAGVARSTRVIDQLAVNITDEAQGFHRNETFFRTNGRFAIEDLPAGSYKIAIGSAGRESTVRIDLRENEHKTGVSIELAELVTLTGRVVDFRTQNPVEGVSMFAIPLGGWSRHSRRFDDKRENVTNASGRFIIRGAPTGRLVMTGEVHREPYGVINVVRTIAGSGTIDVGDIAFYSARSEAAGDLGLTFEDTSGPWESWSLKVRTVNPAGAAARAGIKVGDVVTAIDGIDVTGPASSNSWALLWAPAGTKIRISLARGITVEVVLAKN